MHVGFLVAPRFSSVALTNALEPLRMANRLAGAQIHSWSLYSINGGPVLGGDGLTVMPTEPLDETAPPQALLVCGAAEADDAVDKEMLPLLQRLAQRRKALGALCNGIYTLAEAGALDGYRCAARWEDLWTMRASFPHIVSTPNLFVVDRDRYTCTGGVASVDFMLHLITPSIGRAHARAISQMLGLERIRDQTDRQRLPLEARIAGTSNLITQAAQLMEANLEEPLSLEEIAQLSGVSQRQMQRVFRSRLGVTPARYYATVRLRHARELLKETCMSVIDVTVACGFRSPCHFSHAYRSFFGHAPSHERRLTRAPAPQLAGISTAATGIGA